MNRLVTNSVCVLVIVVGLATTASSQFGGGELPSVPSGSAPTNTADSGTAAEREKIWNSPSMLRARAWVQEYCERSARVTPEEAKQYMTELENLSPTQMKLWLLKFQHEEEMLQEQQAAFDASRRASLNMAMSVNRATQQAYADINRGETETAELAQQSINTEQSEAFERGLDKQEDLNTYRGPGYYGVYGPYASMYPYLPGYAPPMHVHVHVHPE